MRGAGSRAVAFRSRAARALYVVSGVQWVAILLAGVLLSGIVYVLLERAGLPPPRGSRYSPGRACAS